MEDKDKQDRLKRLIQGSASFDPQTKKKLITKVPDLNEEEINEAIAVFEEEKKEWKGIGEKYKADKAMVSDFLSKSKHEIKEMTHELLGKKEAAEHEKEEQEAEKLINEI